ncbi:MAG: rRNA pseudouridine synthase [Armatimonadetes bacterium]|nr:rRNA pseudouridine synthase [Armatimonadota bacterium]
MQKGIRLHRFIAQCGVCSRRKAEVMIAEGRVEVNGENVVRPGTVVSDSDEVRVDGRTLRQQPHVYIVMHKPRGYLTTMKDEFGRQTVADLLPDVGVAVKPVGRLDKDTDGILLFTNDGELASRLTHPRYSVEKEYEATVTGTPGERALGRLRRGVTVEGRRTRPAEVEVVSARENGAKLRIVLKEGRKRQVRLMCAAVGHPVTRLRRVRFGPLRLKGIRPGECKVLGKSQIRALKCLAGMSFPLPK